MKRYNYLFLLLFCLIVGVVSAQYSVLLNFNGTNSPQGAGPTGSLTLSGNRLYGMTLNGGLHDSGCIFSLDTNGNGYRDLFDFYETNGKFPYGSLTIAGNKLFGMTTNGGAYGYTFGGGYGYGVIFSIDTDGSAYRVLLNFNDTNGEYGVGSLLLSGSVLYGMTGLGVFSIDTNGSNFRNLFDFSDTNIGDSYGSLIISGEVLYGLANGGVYGYGCVFSLDTDGSGYKDLLDFNGTNGSYPDGSLIISEGILYGMSAGGNIFSLDTDGRAYQDLFDFNGTNGSGPFGSLIIDRGVLYGMTSAGGINFDGNIFSIDTNGNGFRDLFYFDGANGETPFYGNLIISGNILYGMARSGGTNDFGVVFKIDTGTVTSIKGALTNTKMVSVFPNPNNGIFTVSLSPPPAGGSQTIEIYNVLGEKVFTSSLPPPNGGGASFSYEINLSSQPGGVYFYRVLDDTGELLGEGKFVVE